MKVASVEIADSDANPVPTLYTEALLRTRSLGHSPGRRTLASTEQAGGQRTCC